jgi:hypothetical protein
MNSIRLLLLFLALWVASVSALGHIPSRPPCTPKEGVVLYLDRWEKRDCVGLSLPVGTTNFSQPIYGHTITVPSGYQATIHKAPLLIGERVTTFNTGSRFVSYALWDTPIVSITVAKG